MSSFSSGVTFSTTHEDGIPAPAAPFTYRLRICTTPYIWTSCTVRAGTHSARVGGTIQTRRAVRTRIVPATAKMNWARAGGWGLVVWRWSYDVRRETAARERSP